MKKRPNTATDHTQSRKRGAQTTSRLSALVRGRSTQFIANPCRWPQRPCPKRGYISAIFPNMYYHRNIYICASQVKHFGSVMYAQQVANVLNNTACLNSTTRRATALQVGAPPRFTPSKKIQNVFRYSFPLTRRADVRQILTKKNVDNT